MREWKIAQMYRIMDYDFAIGIAYDDPHVLGIFASYINAGRLFLIHEFSYKEESEIDSFSTEIFPTIVRDYIVEKKRSHNESFDSPTIKRYIQNQMDKEKIEQLLNETEKFHKGATPRQIAESIGTTVQRAIALLWMLEQEKKVIKFREYNQNYFRTP